MVVLAAVLVPGGCAVRQSFNPVDWWHGLEGGEIAQTRPPPPNADAPYPNLATVPPKPPPPSPAALQTVATTLEADRSSAHYAAIAAPIPTLPPPTRPTAPPQPAPAAGDDEQPNASLQAANAKPPSPAQPSAPATAPAMPAAVQPATAPGTAAPATTATADAIMPDMPAAPPPPPQLSGVPMPRFTAPTLPPVAPPAPPPAPRGPGTPLAIAFPAGSAVLPEAARPSLQALAHQRGTRAIAVTGFGDAGGDTAAVQAAALPLALDRARAVAAALYALGVPAAAVHIAALPTGGGAAARLVD